MILLDTTVVSELMRQAPEPLVHRWFGAQDRATLFTTSITKAEILYGIGRLPSGRRKATLTEAAERMFAGAFAARLLPFDATAAVRYAEIVVARERAGAPVEALDAQIAAIALARGAAVATRNVRDFEGCGVEIVNPWTAE